VQGGIIPECEDRDVVKDGPDRRPSAAVQPAKLSEKERVRLERQLVERCLKGEVAAWEELYEKHHTPLLRCLAILLGPRGGDRNLVDELAAQVWYALVDDDGKLLGKFSPKRGTRLNTFIRAVAKDTTTRHFRAERRRRRRERQASKKAPTYADRPEELDASLSEFLGTLSESERDFAEDYLLAEPSPHDDDDEEGRSEASIWQFSRRIRMKLREFVGLDG